MIKNNKNLKAVQSNKIIYSKLVEDYFDLPNLVNIDSDQDGIMDFVFEGFERKNVLLRINDEDLDNDGINNYFDHEYKDHRPKLFEFSEFKIVSGIINKTDNEIADLKNQFQKKSKLLFNTKNASWDYLVLEKLMTELNTEQLNQLIFLSNEINTSVDHPYFKCCQNGVLQFYSLPFYEKILMLRDNEFKSKSDKEFLVDVVGPEIKNSIQLYLMPKIKGPK